MTPSQYHSHTKHVLKVFSKILTDEENVRDHTKQQKMTDFTVLLCLFVYVVQQDD